MDELTDAEVTLDDGTTTTLTDPELDLFFALLVVAGNETTRNAISKGLMAFMEHRDQWDRWIAHPELADTMVEEVLRYTSPVNFFRRTATADTELGGQHITAGQKVVLWYPSANRDPRPSSAPTPTTSTSAGSRTTTWPSGAAVPTSASGPTWPGSRSR